MTPKGVEEKARLTARFLKRKMTEYESLKVEIEQLKNEFNRLGMCVRKRNQGLSMGDQYVDIIKQVKSICQDLSQYMVLGYIVCTPGPCADAGDFYRQTPVLS